MIILLSTTEFEYSTDEIMEWLSFYKAKYVRLNGEDLENKKVHLTLNGTNILADKGINLMDKLTIFNRRWTRFSYINSIIMNHNEPGIEGQIKNFLKLEFSSVSKHIFNLLDTDNTIWVDHPKFVRLNKLTVLRQAHLIGLKVPKTLITNNKSDLIKFKRDHRKIITKTIGELTGLETSSSMFSIGTKEVKQEFIDNLPHDFYLSKFQESIEKKYEIRSFYLDGDFYSMAIFSQRREESKVDFRNYDMNDPDRMVPYQLPDNIQDKLNKLMKAIDLKTGSIDLICTPSDDFIFLEVNPVGQFGMVSKPCNYYLEKRIAEYLIKIDNR